MNLVQSIGSELWSLAFGYRSLFSAVYLLPTAILAYLIWHLRGRPSSFGAFLLPREIYLHPSSFVDVKLALANAAIGATGLLASLAFAPLVTVATVTHLTGLSGLAPTDSTTWAGSALAAIILILTQDFCRYWNHYIHHETRVLWPFHAVHHSAEVLTPLTFLRRHPVYAAFQALLMAALLGIAQGIVLFLVVGHIELWVAVASSGIIYIYMFFGGHLRHSHIWLSYGRRLEHILISPAQHQIHHSSDPRHFDRNYGEIFAIWDWMFGTLYIPDGPEDLRFGIADRDGRMIEQPHPTLRAALVGPFVDAWQEFRTQVTRDPIAESRQDQVAGRAGK